MGYWCNFINDDNVKKEILNLVSGYAKIAILTNTDQRTNVIDLKKDLKEGVFADVGKLIKLEEIKRAYNDEMIEVSWEGYKLSARAEPAISTKELAKNKLFRKN